MTMPNEFDAKYDVAFEDGWNAQKQRFEKRQKVNIRKAQKIVLDIWQTWYGGAPEWTPGNNMDDLLCQIGNSLLGLPEFHAANNARITAQNEIGRIGETK